MNTIATNFRRDLNLNLKKSLQHYCAKRTYKTPQSWPFLFIYLYILTKNLPCLVKQKHNRSCFTPYPAMIIIGNGV